MLMEAIAAAAADLNAAEKELADARAALQQFTAQNFHWVAGRLMLYGDKIGEIFTIDMRLKALTLACERAGAKFQKCLNCWNELKGGRR